MSGLAFFAYVLLWIIVPKAKTASDRLAMTGQTINIESIAKQVEEEEGGYGLNELVCQFV